MTSQMDMPKSVIPVSKNVVQMMQTRLEEVEDSANQLTQEIVLARQQGSTDRLSILLSKTQSMESVLQSLKLNFVNLSTLTRQPSDLEQKLVEMTDIYTEEVKKISFENAHLKTDKQELNEKRQQTEIELQRVRITLEQVKNLQVEKEDAILAERSRCESLLRKVAELDLQLAEERQLRFGLDKSNTELGQRLDEMDLMLKQEHLETQNFTGDFIKLKKDYSKKCEELKQGKCMQKEMKNEMVTVCQELDAKLTELDGLKGEKDKITNEMSTVHEKYSQLNSQLETMQHLFTEYQKDKADMEADTVKLNAKINELDSENSDLTQQLIRAQKNDDSARLIDTRQQLRHMTKDRDQLKSDNEALTERVEDLESNCLTLDKELEKFKKNAVKETESKYAVIGGLQERLSALKSELMSLEGEKENILTEVNGAVDAMDGERTAMQTELDSCRQQLTSALDDLDEEQTRSRDLDKKLQAYEMKPDFMQFDRRLTELTEQKNSLSYENGKLQSQVEQCQAQIESMTKEQGQFEKVSKKLAHASNSIKKMKHELDSCKQSLAHSELTSQQLQTTSEMRETDYNAAIRSRDEAVRDARALAARLETMEEALQQQEELKSGVEERLREDNIKVTESLENMMALHTELQCKYESLQIELGRKDTQLNEFKKEKKKQQDKLSRVENQLEMMSGKLSGLQGKQTNQTKNLEREIKSVKMDNSKLVRTLQDTLELSEQLRVQVSLLEETLCKQKVERDKFAARSEELEGKLKQQESSHVTRISELEAQVGKEWDKASQHVQVKSTEITELNRKNDSLKRKLNELKSEIHELKGDLKHKNKRLSKLKGLEEEDKGLYTANEELSARCQSQEKTINKFISQFKEVQKEMKELVLLHTEQTEALEEKDRLLNAEEMRCSELRNKYHEAKKQVAASQEILKTTESKLIEANNDTQIATETLEDTNRYFKERFSALACELSSAKKQRLNLEWNNLEKHHRLALEQQRVEETAAKARDMIKASRHQLSDIADRTDLEQSIRDEQAKNRSTHRAYNSMLSPSRRELSMADTSMDNILSVSQEKSPHNRSHSSTLHQQSALSPFTSSSQKLDAIIGEMEKRRLIS